MATTEVDCLFIFALGFASQTNPWLVDASVLCFLVDWLMDCLLRPNVFYHLYLHSMYLASVLWVSIFFCPAFELLSALQLVCWLFPYVPLSQSSLLLCFVDFNGVLSDIHGLCIVSSLQFGFISHPPKWTHQTSPPPPPPPFYVLEDALTLEGTCSSYQSSSSPTSSCSQSSSL